MPASKPTNTCRIFILGESAASPQASIIRQLATANPLRGSVRRVEYAALPGALERC